MAGGTLYVIATPIGNLGDVTVRALDTLRALDLLLAEDTRVTRRLLDRYEIKVPMESYREEVHARKIRGVIDALAAGKSVGIVSDAGTPGVSDPGCHLVRDVVAALPEVTITPIPGACAAVSAFSVAGFQADEFTFLGFPPHKKGRAGFFTQAMSQPRVVVFYESTHRISKALESLASIDPERQLLVCRELTKIHETLYRGTASAILAQLQTTSSRGEFVVVVRKAEKLKS